MSFLPPQAIGAARQPDRRGARSGAAAGRCGAASGEPGSRV
jgi:hypothetical protein